LYQSILKTYKIMKKLMLFAAVAVFGLSNVNAQEVSFGAKAGVNFASVGGDDSDGLDGRTSFHVGGVAVIGISEKFAVQPEVVYSSQGAKETFEGIDIDYNLDYINVPVLAKFTVAEGFSIEAGPQVGFLMSAKAKGEGETVDIKDQFKGIDFSGAVGLGYKMETGLNFAARYNLGLGNIVDGEGDLKNNVIQLSVGYNF
jgi:hypothetical protein